MADLQTLLSYFLQDLLSGNVGTTLSTGLLAKDGTSAAPSIALASEPGLGFYKAATGYMGVANDNGSTPTATLGPTGVNLGSGIAVTWGSAAAATAGLGDTTLVRNGAAGVLKVANGTAANTAEFQVSGGSGGFISPVKALTELTTIAAAAATNTGIAIPVNVIVWAVSVRVVTAIPTAATFTVTSATPAKTWNTVAVPVAANTTDPGTLGAGAVQTAASVITITPNLTPAAATGQVRVTIYFSAVTPATS